MERGWCWLRRGFGRVRGRREWLWFSVFSLVVVFSFFLGFGG